MSGMIRDWQYDYVTTAITRREAISSAPSLSSPAIYPTNLAFFPLKQTSGYLFSALENNAIGL
jgi:hypothetical protein